METPNYKKWQTRPKELYFLPNSYGYRCEALMLAGDKDITIPKRFSEALRDAWEGDVEYKCFPHLNHDVVVLSPDILPLLKSFVNRH